MLWYVNPINSNKMVNLTVLGSISLKKNMIYLDEHTWMFENSVIASDVYEAMVKLCQQDRYRAPNVKS